MITQTWTTSFKRQLLLGEHNLEVDEIKIALYTASALLGPNTQEYSDLDEVTGLGYTEGGQILQNVTVQSGNGIAYVSFDNPSWPGSSFSTRGALIYNASKDDKSIAVLNFGTTQTTTNQTFELLLPADNPTFALLRLV